MLRCSYQYQQQQALLTTPKMRLRWELEGDQTKTRQKVAHAFQKRWTRQPQQALSTPPKTRLRWELGGGQTLTRQQMAHAFQKR